MPVIALPSELVALREALRSFVQREVSPREAAHTDEIRRTGTFAAVEADRRALRKRSAAAGYYALFVPEDCGGGGVGHLGMVLGYEETSRHGLLLGLAGGVLPGVEGPSAILLAGTPAQRERYLYPTMRAEREACFALTEPDAGSDATRIRTRAERAGDGWVLNGHKHFITHGADADYAIVFAVTGGAAAAAGGISCFLVDTDTPGFAVAGRQRTMFDEHQAELVLSDVRVGQEALLGPEHEGFRAAMRFINRGRLSIAGMALGIAEHLYGRMVAYARVREAFGRPIGANQYVQAMVVDSLAELRQARLLVYELADAIDAGASGRQEAAMAKYVATEMVGRVADRAIQLFGGNGYMTELGIERWARFVRGMRLYEGTSEILKDTVARSLGLPAAGRG